MFSKLEDIRKRYFGERTARILLFAMAAAVMLLVIVKDSTVCMTYDESATYTNWVRPILDSQWDFKRIWQIVLSSTGNNHLLNTVCVIISECIFKVRYNEMVVRLPSLIACIAYLCLVLYLHIRKQMGFTGCCFLILNYYAIDFFSLARGYCLALTAVFVALICLKDWHGMYRDRSLLWCFVLLGVATSANTVCLLLTLSVGAYVLMLLLRRRELLSFMKRHIVFGALLALYNSIMTAYHFMITAHDGALYYSTEMSPLKIIRGFLEMYVSRQYQHPSLLNICVWICFLAVLFGCGCAIKNQSGLFAPILTLYLAFAILLAVITGKGVPYGRVLLPTFPLFIFSLVEIYRLYMRPCFENCVRGGQCLAVLKGVSVIILLYFFIARVDLQGSVDWKHYAAFKTSAYEAYGRRTKVTADSLGAPGLGGITFYRGQILDLYGYDIFED